MMKTPKLNIARELFVANATFILLYFTISIFMIILSSHASGNLILFGNGLVAICFFTTIGIFILIARSMIHIEGDTLDEQTALRDFLISRVLFHSSIGLFFTVVFLWILSLGGVIDSVFAALLCTAPVFFIFGMHDGIDPEKIDSVIDNPRINRQSHRLNSAAKAIKIYVYLVYFSSVISFDFTVLANMLGVVYDFNVFNYFLDPSFREIKEQISYHLLGIITFLGSAIAAVLPYYVSEKHRPREPLE